MSNQDLLKAAYAAFNRRDIDSVLALMHPDVDWPNGIDGGRMNGRDEVRQYWTRQWQVLNPRVEPMRIEDDESGNMIVRVHQLIRDLDGDVILDQMVEHVYSIKAGLIERMDIRHP